jgi:VHL beta domain
MLRSIFKAILLVVCLAFGNGIASASAQTLAGNGCSELSGLKSATHDQTVSVIITNRSSKTLDVFWADYDGRLVLNAKLAPNQPYGVQTFVGHPWVIKDESGRCIRAFVAKDDEAVSITNELPAATKAAELEERMHYWTKNLPFCNYGPNNGFGFPSKYHESYVNHVSIEGAPCDDGDSCDFQCVVVLSGRRAWVRYRRSLTSPKRRMVAISKTPFRAPDRSDRRSRCFRIKAEQNRDVSGPFPLVSYQIPLEPPDPARDLGDAKPFLCCPKSLFY